MADTSNTIRAAVSPLSRRRALSFLTRALAGGAVAAGSLTGAAAAVEQFASTPDWMAPWRAMAAGENPVLLERGQEMQKAFGAFLEADQRKNEARKVCDSLWPTLPPELVFTKADRELGLVGHRLRDPEGNDVWPDNPAQMPTSVIEASTCRWAMADYNGRTKNGKHARRKLPIAEAYEAACASAKERSGIDAAIEARYFAASKVEHVAQGVREQRALTLVGIHIKARAIAAMASVGKDYEFRALLLGGRSFADNVASVIGLGDAVVAGA